MIGEHIKKARVERGISVNEIHQKTGIARHNIYRIENNKQLPHLCTLMLIADVLDVSLDELAGRGG